MSTLGSVNATQQRWLRSIGCSNRHQEHGYSSDLDTRELLSKLNAYKEKDSWVVEAIAHVSWISLKQVAIADHFHIYHVGCIRPPPPPGLIRLTTFCPALI